MQLPTIQLIATPSLCVDLDLADQLLEVWRQYQSQQPETSQQAVYYRV
jgi:hypothetical protein